MNQAFKEELIKIAKKDQADGIGTGLVFGATAGMASTIGAHPIEHKLYGDGKKFWPHLGARLGKGIVASTLAFGTYRYLNENEDKIKDWGTSVKNDTKKYFK